MAQPPITPGRRVGAPEPYRPIQVDHADIAKAANNLIPSSTDLDFEPFKGEGPEFYRFYKWTKNVVRLLELYDMKFVIDEPEEEPEKPVVEDYTNDAVGIKLFQSELRLWHIDVKVRERKEKLFVTCVLKKLSGVALSVAQHMTTGYTVWKALNLHFLPPQPIYEDRFHKYWINFRMRSDQTVDSFIDEFDNRMEIYSFYRKRDHDVDISMDDVAAQFVLAIDKSYSNTINYYTMQQVLKKGVTYRKLKDIAIAEGAIIQSTRSMKKTESKTAGKTDVKKDVKVRSVETEDTEEEPVKKKAKKVKPVVEPKKTEDKKKPEKKKEAVAAREYGHYADTPTSDVAKEEAKRKSESKDRLTMFPDVECWNCKKMGHYSGDCDQPKTNRYKARMVKVTDMKKMKKELSTFGLEAELKTNPEYMYMDEDEFTKNFWRIYSVRERDNLGCYPDPDYRRPIGDIEDEELIYKKKKNMKWDTATETVSKETTMKPYEDDEV